MFRPLVIFDLDGTLLHTAPDLLVSLNHSIEVLGIQPVGHDDIDSLVGAGARAMIQRALDLRQIAVDTAQLDRLFERFLDHYSRTMPGTTVPYPGLIAALDRLDEAGMSLAVCTNKTEALARRLLDLLRMARRFSAITGGDTFAYRKPHGDHILGTIDQAGGSPAATVMVGDSINDITAARNAGIPSIAVPFGYSDTAVEDLAPDTVIRHYEELTPQLVSRLLG